MNTDNLKLPSGLNNKVDCLKNNLRNYDRIAVAFSGGVDSAFLLAAAKQAGPESVLGITTVSHFFTHKELSRARRMAERLSVDHLCVDINIMEKPEVVKNDVQRCYHCKHYSFSLIKNVAIENGISNVVHGINVDDLGDYRPGIKAAKELGFEAPLVTAGFSKADIRACAKAMNLDAWDLASQSCLATRIPMGTMITKKALMMVEKAEDFLHSMKLGQVRVRNHGELARIEVPVKAFASLMEDGVRDKLVQAFMNIGFRYVSLDLGGYETGKMNPK